LNSNEELRILDRIEDSKRARYGPYGMYQLFLGNGLSTGLLAVSSIIVARLLGPANYGLYSIALILPPFVVLIGQFGLGAAATRFSAKYVSEGAEKHAVSFLFSIILFEIVASVASVIVLSLFSSNIAIGIFGRPQLAAIILPIAIMSVIGQVLYTITSSGFVGLGRFDLAAIFQTIQSVLRLGFSAALIVLGFAVVGAVSGYSLGFVISGVLATTLIVVMVIRGGRVSKFSDDLKAALRYSYPVYLAQLAGGFDTPFVLAIMANSVSNSQVGGFNAAANVSVAITLFTYPISTVLFPIFSKSVVNGAELAHSYRLSIKYSALFVVPTTMAVIALSSPLVNVVFGSKYSFASGYLAVFASQFLIVGIGALSWSNFLNGIGETMASFKAYLYGTILAVLSAVPLIKLLGVYGAILALILGALCSVVYGNYEVRKKANGPLEIWAGWKIYLAAGLTALVVYPFSLLTLNGILIILIGVSIYLLVFVPILALLGGINKSELEFLQSNFEKITLVSKPFGIIVRYYSLFYRSENR
jgi:stage V sporulation protein B